MKRMEKRIKGRRIKEMKEWKWRWLREGEKIMENIVIWIRNYDKIYWIKKNYLRNESDKVKDAKNILF